LALASGVFDDIGVDDSDEAGALVIVSASFSHPEAASRDPTVIIQRELLAINMNLVVL
jgi:hypothetical protein